MTAHYSPRADGGLKVINRGFNPQKQQWQESEGKAYFIGSPQVAALKVSFFGPFYGGYNVIALGPGLPLRAGVRPKPRLSVDPVAHPDA